MSVHSFRDTTDLRSGGFQTAKKTLKFKRPTSARSNSSVLSFTTSKSIKQVKRGFGYFGDDNEKYREMTK